MTSGSVEAADLEEPPARAVVPDEAGGALEITESRTTTVGTLQVRRSLPTRRRRTVGAWCFVDHAGPTRAGDSAHPDIGPHPHMGLHTVTWLLEGEMLHRDSLGTEQLIRPGELNLMTAGHGIAHAEEATSKSRPTVHLLQLWVAQPAATRDGPPAFEHHSDLPRVAQGHATATVLIGSFGGAESSARRDTDMVGLDLDVRRGRTVLPLDPSFEHAVVVTDGDVAVDGAPVTPGRLVFMASGREELALAACDPARVLLIGGVPFPEPLVMWWNLVARTREEIETGYLDWSTDSGRFGRVASARARVETAPPIWMPRPSA